MSPVPPKEEEEAKDDRDNDDSDPKVLRGLVDCPSATDSQTITFLSTAAVITISNRTIGHTTDIGKVEEDKWMI